MVTFSKTIKMSLLIFFFFLQAEENSQVGQRREKKKTLCANNYASTNSNKSNPSLVAAEKGFISKILAQQALANLSTALLCQETSSKERPRQKEETKVCYDTSCVCTCVLRRGAANVIVQRVQAVISGGKPT